MKFSMESCLRRQLYLSFLSGVLLSALSLFAAPESDPGIRMQEIDSLRAILSAFIPFILCALLSTSTLGCLLIAPLCFIRGFCWNSAVLALLSDNEKSLRLFLLCSILTLPLFLRCCEDAFQQSARLKNIASRKIMQNQLRS